MNIFIVIVAFVLFLTQFRFFIERDGCRDNANLNTVFPIIFFLILYLWIKEKSDTGSVPFTKHTKIDNIWLFKNSYFLIYIYDDDGLAQNNPPITLWAIKPNVLWNMIPLNSTKISITFK